MYFQNVQNQNPLTDCAYLSHKSAADHWPKFFELF